ncbi:MAG TPA: PQQ-dependent sugar dehydrogenase [Fibrobacteria bacterium]|nr:PQQ-dependent sugar dehydrogenase [Fibrobacteria bacterium]
MHHWKTLLLGALAIGPAMAQLTYNGCAALQSGDFQMTELFSRKGGTDVVMDGTLSEPTHMDVRTTLKGDGTFDHADIVFVERLGNVKFYDGAAKRVSVMGKINVWGKSDNGLMGVAFDPGYARNRWLYLWYSPKELIGSQTNGNRQLRLTRITVKSDNTLDMASEKILINILGSKTDTWHSGGPMTFDSYGDLWVAVGNNSTDLDPVKCSAGENVLSQTDSTASAEWGPSNTASLRGGFFRIHPDSSDRGYSIPRGNFGEYWADQFEKQGKADLAAQYRNPRKVLPEVYVKGERSNFSIAVHPTKRWLAWGTVNYSNVNDEFNITDHPVFTGFPYFHGNNLPTCDHHKDVNAPENTSKFNSGVTDLPPAVPGTLNNLVNVAIGGPIYSFDRSLNSKDKFPPHFDNKWLVAGFNGGMWAVTLDTNTLKSVNTQKMDNGLFGGFRLRNHVMSMYGKDGALYVLNYDGYYDQTVNPGAMRVAYKGACTVPLQAAGPKPQPYRKIWLSQTALTVGEAGPHEFGLYDVSGHRVFRARSGGGAEYPFSRLGGGAGLKRGVYTIRVETLQGSFVRRISLL